MICNHCRGNINRIMPLEMERKVYHEKQTKEMCALHALNNLFQQQKCFTKQQLDNICNKLSPNSYVNPHKSLFGLGNYDVNVIMSALQDKQHEAIWFDKRRDIRCLQITNIKGFILNIPSEFKWGVVKFPFTRKHWICVRKISDSYYNLDSKLNSPEIIGNELEVLTYLKDQMECKDKELFLVVDKQCAETEGWMNTDYAHSSVIELNSSAPIAEHESIESEQAIT